MSAVRIQSWHRIYLPTKSPWTRTHYLEAETRYLVQPSLQHTRWLTGDFQRDVDHRRSVCMCPWGWCLWVMARTIRPQGGGALYIRFTIWSISCLTVGEACARWNWDFSRWELNVCSVETKETESWVKSEFVGAHGRPTPPLTASDLEPSSADHRGHHRIDGIWYVVK